MKLSTPLNALLLCLIITPLSYATAQDWAQLKRYEKDNVRWMNTTSNEEKVVFMGNSITEGWSKFRPSFFEGKAFINRGISGQTTPQMLLRFQQDVIHLNPAIVVILAGINDIAGNTGPSSIDMIYDNIISMVLLAKSNDIKVILCSVLPANKFPWRPEIDPTHNVVALNQLLKKYAIENDIEYVDYYSDMVNDEKGLRPELGDDGVHPNEAGYEIMEKILEPIIEKTKASSNQELSSISENKIFLWEKAIPNAKRNKIKEKVNDQDVQWVTQVHIPWLEVFTPPKRKNRGTAIVICPGGGYEGLAYDWEGTDIAKWLNTQGVTAFVLKSRLPNEKVSTKPSFAPIQDAQRAMRLVRKNAKKWKIDKDKIGIMGFSAGGHLAASLVAHSEKEHYKTMDATDKVSAKPNFSVLIYPVITMNNQHTHQGSKINLLGKNANNEMVKYFSTELHITDDTPPTFLVHTSDDQAVPVMNSILYYQALQQKRVSSSIHIYPEGGHGYALAVGQKLLNSWPDRLIEWLEYLK